MNGIARTTALALALLAACGGEPSEDAPRYRTTLQELVLEDARRCDSGFEYPARLVEGLGQQLVEELVCEDPSRLAFYASCREPGCIYADGPQPHAMRPEVIDALEGMAAGADDFVSVTAGYRDVAMQYYSRWYKENCSSSFHAAEPGASNHQGGRAVDVRYYAFWHDALLAAGFTHPIPGDEPHYEWPGSAAFRAQSLELRQESIAAFQRLWNANHPEAPLEVSGVYDAATKEALGRSPVDGFERVACGEAEAPDAGSEPADAAASDAGSDAHDATTSDAHGDPLDAHTIDGAGSADDGARFDDPASPDAFLDVYASDAGGDGPGSDGAATAVEGRDGLAARDVGGPPRPRPAVSASRSKAEKHAGCASAGGAAPGLWLLLLLAPLTGRPRLRKASPHPIHGAPPWLRRP